MQFQNGSFTKIYGSVLPENVNVYASFSGRAICPPAHGKTRPPGGGERGAPGGVLAPEQVDDLRDLGRVVLRGLQRVQRHPRQRERQLGLGGIDPVGGAAGHAVLHDGDAAQVDQAAVGRDGLPEAATDLARRPQHVPVVAEVTT